MLDGGFLWSVGWWVGAGAQRSARRSWHSFDIETPASSETRRGSCPVAVDELDERVVARLAGLPQLTRDELDVVGVRVR